MQRTIRPRWYLIDQIRHMCVTERIRQHITARGHSMPSKPNGKLLRRWYMLGKEIDWRNV